MFGAHSTGGKLLYNVYVRVEGKVYDSFYVCIGS